MDEIWRDPPEESDDLYPGLVVHDNRVTGSITAGKSRLPLWAFIGEMGYGKGVTEGYNPEQYGWTEARMLDFLYFLLEARGEIGRLLLVIADAERRERNREDEYIQDHNLGPVIDVTPGRDTAEAMPEPWYRSPDLAKPVIAQLRRCLAALEPLEAEEGYCPSVEAHMERTGNTNRSATERVHRLYCEGE